MTDPISPAGSPALANVPSASRGAPVSTATSPAAAPPEQALNPAAQAAQDAEVQRAVSDSNAKLSRANINLQFQFDLGSNGAVRSVKLLDSATQKVVMQYPSETMLAIRDQIDQMIQQNEKASLNAGSLFSQLA